jgi:hypothetical protein
VTDIAKPWTPTVPHGGKLEDISLNHWVGEALGAASMCWNPRPEGVFDSSSATVVYDSLMAHINEVIQGVIDGTTKAVKNAD